MKKRTLLLLLGVLLATAFGALFTGRYTAGPLDIVKALWAWVSGVDISGTPEQGLVSMLVHIRLPRVLAALIIGAALAVSGTVYQAMFLNPLVSPGVLGVLSGASFGAGLGIVVFSSWQATQVLAFVCACLAVGMSLFFAAFMKKSSLLVLILAGMISSSFFTSLTAFLKFVADPNRQLPELTYWLMGTFARIDGFTLTLLGLPMLAGIIFLALHGKIINALSMGDEEALSLGVSVRPARLRIIGVATFISAMTVVLVGVVGWVGLVIPHILRFLVGPDNRVLLPASAIGGAIFMMGTDMLARNIMTAELPIGIFTSLISLPIFVVSLRYSKGGWR